MAQNRTIFIIRQRGRLVVKRPFVGQSGPLFGICWAVARFPARVVLISSQNIAVGTAVTGGPPHRSVREALPHTAPALSLA